MDYGLWTMDYGHWAQNALNHFHLLSASIVVNLSINGCGDS